MGHRSWGARGACDRDWLRGRTDPRRRGCLKLYRKVDKALGETISRSRAANPVIFSQVPDAGCRAELRISAANIRLLKRVRRAFRRIARAEPIGSMADAERSLKLLAELEKLLAELEAQPSAAQARASFQKACGPSQPM